MDAKTQSRLSRGAQRTSDLLKFFFFFFFGGVQNALNYSNPH